MKTTKQITTIAILAAAALVFPACVVRPGYIYTSPAPTVKVTSPAPVIVRERTSPTIIREEPVYVPAPRPTVIVHRPIHIVNPAPRPAVIVVNRPARIIPRPRPCPPRVIPRRPIPLGAAPATVKYKKFDRGGSSKPRRVHYTTQGSVKTSHYQSPPAPARPASRPAVRPTSRSQSGDNRINVNVYVGNEATGSKVSSNRNFRPGKSPSRPDRSIRKSVFKPKNRANQPKTHRKNPANQPKNPRITHRPGDSITAYNAGRYPLSGQRSSQSKKKSNRPKFNPDNKGKKDKKGLRP